MQFIEVKDSSAVKEFHKVPQLIYKDDPYYVAHLQQDIDGVFDKKKNKFFRHGEAIRWVLKSNDGKLLGRVAAFINDRDMKEGKMKVGGMGFFESVNDKDVAFALFDQCKKWLQSKGIEAMDGPINFGEKDKYWGLIIDNFDRPPYYTQNYNPAYYVQLFEEYGFQIYFKQYIFYRTCAEPLQEKFVKRAEEIAKDPRYTFRRIEKNKLEKYAEDFRTVYNRAWVKHDNHKGMPQVQAMSLMNKMKPLIDEDLIYFAYYDEKPVGFYISLPEINQVFKKVNGNFNWWGKLKFLYYFKWKKICKTSFGIAFGIDPEHQGKGLEGAMFNEMGKVIQPTMKYDDIIVTWIGDFNPKMISILEGIGTKKIRTMATYRKLFDENAVFERAPIIK
jgi:GNAT superfamily N-acetyltransferase